MAVATAFVILGGSIAPFLTPGVVRFEQDRTGVAALTGFESPQLDRITSSMLGDLVFWGGDFQISRYEFRNCLCPVLNDAERAHMRDVRSVFTGFWLVVLASVAVLVFGFWRARALGARAAAWRAVRTGARGLAIVVAVAGVFALVAFDAAFEVFHRLFFSEGSYTFDPATDRLVQLFPERFWSEISIAVGAVVIIVAIVTAWYAGRRAIRLTPVIG
jgi:integral membrane protein (TIGR01906 family)